jgi:LysM repeat protein
MSIKSKFSKLSIALLSGAAIGAAMITTSGSASADEIYTVKSGDTLSEISYAFNLNGDYNSIAKANNIKNVDVIEVGQKLVITNNGSIKKATKSEVKSLPEVAKNTNAANAATTTTSNNTTTATSSNNTTTNTTATTTNTSSVGGSVSSVASAMAARTGVSASTWQRIIMRESGGNGSVSNASSGAYGYFQLLGHGEHQGMSAAEQVNMAASVYNSQGMSAWGE